MLQINFNRYRLKVLLQRQEDAVHVFTVSSAGQMQSFALLEGPSESSAPLSPHWTPLVVDVLHAMVDRCSLARHSTKC